METFKTKALSIGLCEPYSNEWLFDTSLVERYVKGISWCMPRMYPSLKDMEDYDKELLENDVYNSKVVDLILTGDTYILNNSHGIVEIVDWNVSRIYVGLDSVVKIKAGGNSILYVDSYDNSNIQIEASDLARVVVHQYGNSAIQVLCGKVIIKDRRNDSN